jgi:hypothetical protein
MHIPHPPSQNLQKHGRAYRFHLDSLLFTGLEFSLCGYKGLFYLFIRFQITESDAMFHFVRFIYGPTIGIM